MMDQMFHGKLGLQQRVIPTYRALFLDSLAKKCAGGLSVFSGKPLASEGIEPVKALENARYVQGRNLSLLDPSSPLFVCWQHGLMGWLEQWQPDALIVEANPRYLATRQAISWMHRRGGIVIGWGLGAPAIGGQLAAFRKRERSGLLDSLDAIIAYSRRGAEQYRQLGIATEKVYVAFNAVGAAPLFPPAAKPLPGRGQASVLFIGRLQQRKRVDLLIQACAALPAELQPRLVIVGDGPNRTEWEYLANRIYPNAEFAGAKHGADLEPFLAKADLFVLPGTGGLAIQEAMAHGLPVIAAQGDGTQDDLVRDVNGWQVPSDDLQALTQALYQALSDPARLRRMGEASYHIVANEINVDKMVEVFVRVVNHLTANHAALRAPSPIRKD